jgi:hypothetical protein
MMWAWLREILFHEYMDWDAFVEKVEEMPAEEYREKAEL